MFTGTQTGPVSWLADYDRLEQEITGQPELAEDSLFIEANRLIRQGYYLKLGGGLCCSRDNVFKDSRR